jgi:hypothetical protein
MRARHRLSKLLLRHGVVCERRAWTQEHDAWPRRQRLAHPGARAAFEDHYQAVLTAALRRDRLEQIAEVAADSPVVRRPASPRSLGARGRDGRSVAGSSRHLRALVPVPQAQEPKQASALGAGQMGELPSESVAGRGAAEHEWDPP